MERKDLELRIEKKQADIEKTKRSINKFIAKNNFTDGDQEVAKNATWKEIRDYYREWSYPKQTDFDDLARRYHTLEDQNVTLQKYLNQLEVIRSQEDRESTTEKIPVIVEFLGNWKQDVIKFVEDNTHYVDEYYSFSHEYTEMYNNRWYLIRSGEMSEEELKQALNDLSRKEKRAKQSVSQLTFMVYSYKKGIDYTKLNEILDKDVQSKYWTMVNKVTSITGEITDASRLRIAGDGNLNGIIVGTKGKAKLETVLAGGYNQGVIVNVKHGQILHYRLLVHEVK